MWKYITVGLFLGVGMFVGFYWYLYFSGNESLSPIGSEIERITEKPLEKYSFERLREEEFEGGEIEIIEQVEGEAEEYDSYLFAFEVKNLNDENDSLRGSGLVNVPAEEGEYPAIVQFRGFVPAENFTPGEGTRRSGEYFASNGYITLAPDLLGYGEGDMPSEDGLEERFQTYTTALSLLASVENINEALEDFDPSASSGQDPLAESSSVEPDEKLSKIEARWDEENVGVWGHSNGGHIALAAASISSFEHPLVLWNPVSKHFPYSIFYYMDEYDDQGAALRKLISDFESEYDIEKYSPPNYYKWIEAPIQIHQGLSDREILPWWSEELRDLLEGEEVEVEYVEHANSDHNLMPGGWDSAMAQSEEFYEVQFEEED